MLGSFQITSDQSYAYLGFYSTPTWITYSRLALGCGAMIQVTFHKDIARDYS